MDRQVVSSEGALIKQFNDYDQTVDVVSCWDVISGSVLKAHHFHRFPRFSPGELTPDFAISKEAAGASSAGSMIFDVKKFPDPYPSDGGEPDFRPYDRSINQLRRYAAPISTSAKGITFFFSEHDIVLITKGGLVDFVYKYLSESDIPKPFSLGRPLILIEYTYDASDQQEKYVFRWKQGANNSPFSHPELRRIMVERAQPLNVFPKMFVPSKIRHVICNDEPPTIYLLVFLWLEIFPGLLTEEQFSAWQVRGTSAALHIRTSPKKVIEALREKYSIPVKTQSIRDCFHLLVRARKAVKLSNPIEEEYDVTYSSLHARQPTKNGQEGLQKRIETREYGLIFARMIADADQPSSTKAPSRARRTPLGQRSLFE